MPYSFLDGSKTNYYGSKGELNGYVNGCRKRQEEMIVWLNRLTRWLLARWAAEGTLPLPAGKTSDDIPFTWVGAGTPFWRLIDDSKGYQIAVQNGFTNPEAVCSEHGGNFYDNIDRTAACLEYARQHGIVMPWDPDVMGKAEVAEAGASANELTPIIANPGSGSGISRIPEIPTIPQRNRITPQEKPKCRIRNR